MGDGESADSCGREAFEARSAEQRSLKVELESAQHAGLQRLVGSERLMQVSLQLRQRSRVVAGRWWTLRRQHGAHMRLSVQPSVPQPVSAAEAQRGGVRGGPGTRDRHPGQHRAQQCPQRAGARRQPRDHRAESDGHRAPAASPPPAPGAQQPPPAHHAIATGVFVAAAEPVPDQRAAAPTVRTAPQPRPLQHLLDPGPVGHESRWQKPRAADLPQGPRTLEPPIPRRQQSAPRAPPRPPPTRPKSSNTRTPQHDVSGDVNDTPLATGTREVTP